MKLGVIADDFTGASDIALTLAEGGMQVTQYVGIPASPSGDVTAGVVSLKSRTIPVDQAVAQSLKACEWLIDQGATQIIYKVCSTFDSTDAGNIGQVTAALAERLGENAVIVCPAFPENGRSVYQGHLFVNDRLLSESGMQNHPLTPMTNSDLRQVLDAQTNWRVGHLPINVVGAGAGAVSSALAQTTVPTMYIADAIADADLQVLGKAAADRKLMTGGSGIAIGLPQNFGATAEPVFMAANAGPGVVLSGSCSIATRGQVATFEGPKREVTAQEVMNDNNLVAELAGWVMGQDCPLVYTSADPAVVQQAQQTYGTQTIASAIESMMTNLTRTLAARGITRFVVAGGETSGAAVAGLNATAMRIGPKIAAGVPALAVEGTDLSVALKSGNFGAPDFFAHALRVLKEGS